MATDDIAKLFDLSGQVACLTGGASGMGRSTGIVLAQAGATVILADINEAGLNETARFIEDTGGKVSTMRCDVTNEAEVEALVAKAVNDHGRIDIMGNIAGIPQQSMIVDTTEQMMDDLFAINLKGVFFGVKHAMKAMIPRKSGNIVNVSSGIIDSPVPRPGPSTACRRRPSPCSARPQPRRRPLTGYASIPSPPAW